MQNVILLAVVCVGFFYALYRVYKNSDGTEGSSGCGGNSNRPQKGQYSPNGRYCPFLRERQVFTVLVCYFQPEHDRIAGNGRFCPPSEVFPRGTARGFPCIEDNL